VNAVVSKVRVGGFGVSASLLQLFFFYLFSYKASLKFTPSMKQMVKPTLLMDRL
jgi:hypothetical protein